MRTFTPGEPFIDTQAEPWIPDDDTIAEMRDDIKQMAQDGHPIPVFSEMHLYPRLGKDDARFVLAIADEYTRLIEKLGREKVVELLGVGS